MESAPRIEIDTSESGHGTGPPQSGAGTSVEGAEPKEPVLGSADTLQLHVSLLSGEDLGSFPMAATATVLDLKRTLLRLPALQGTDPRFLRLVFDSQELDDKQSLDDAGVPNGARLQALRCPCLRAEVALRCRPCLPDRPGMEPRARVLELDAAQGLVTFLEAEPELKVQLDCVYPEGSTQQEVFSGTAQSLAEQVVLGQSGLLICYGPTGSGKRHTLFGGGAWLGSLAARSEQPDPLAEGILPRSFDCIATCIQKLSDVTVVVSVSFLAIIQEQVYDLLDGSVGGRLACCKVRCRQHARVEVEGLTRRGVRSVADMRAAFAEGWARHMDWIIAMGGRDSTRLHMVFTIQVDVYDASSCRHSSTLRFAKLAGSEKTGSTGLGLGAYAQPGCAAFEDIVHKLARGADKPAIVPWRNSKSTLLLRDDLEGGARTLLIATCCSAKARAVEIRHTLRVAQHMRRVLSPSRACEPAGEQLCEEELCRRRWGTMATAAA